MSTLTLISSDGKVLEVSDAAAKKLGTIRKMVEGCCTTETDKRITVAMVDGNILSMIVAWSEKHADANANANATAEELRDWDAEFVKDLDQCLLYHLLMAADFLEASDLVDLLAGKVASMIKGKKFHEIRQIFNIKSDFTPEQEAEIISKNAWAFE